MSSVYATARNTVIAICLLALGACTSIQRNPVPEEDHLLVSVLGRQDLRFWGDIGERSEQQVFDFQSGIDLEKRYSGIMHREHHYLSISGGGANGAYGAGVLVGWTDAGTRPEFTIVTGISTGALTAPFAFLGPAYDAQLKEVYTTLDSAHVFTPRKKISIMGSDSFADTAPLSEMIALYITDEVISEIATEYRRGRGLYIGTSNLDAGRPVIWNIGRIANTGHPDAGALIRQVMRASASIPGVFPPAYIEVEAPDGNIYDEMYVDGGVSTQMFLYPPATNWNAVLKAFDVKGVPTAYLIRNSRRTTNYQSVKPRLAPIAGRSVDALIRTQGIGDVYRIYAMAQRDGIEVKLTWIPGRAVEQTSDEVFDPEYMTALYEFGHDAVIAESVWTDVTEIIQRR